MPLDTQGEWALRSTYETTSRQLEEAGQIDQAAFILAELLGNVTAAVGLLEKHGKLREAAEIAEGREIEPGLVIRLWFLAGDRARACDVARRTGAFRDAVIRLEPDHADEANALRLLWASSLAESGAYIEAANVALEAPEGRRLCLAWLEHAAAESGPASAQARVRQVWLDEVHRDSAFDDLSAWLLAEGGSEHAIRAATAHELSALPADAKQQPLLRTLASLAARAGLRDRALGLGNLELGDARKLADFAGNRALVYDLPRPGRIDAPELLHRTLSEDQLGSAPISDAVALPGGRLLVAEGQAGVRVIDRDGRSSARFDVPADALIVSPYGNQVLAVGTEPSVVHRIDLNQRLTSRPNWQPVNYFADAFDGDSWWVARGRSIHQFDVHADHTRSLYDLTMDEPVRLISWSSDSFAILVDYDPPEIWYYEYPGPTLRVRWSMGAEFGAYAISGSHLVAGRVKQAAGQEDSIELFHADVRREESPKQFASIGAADLLTVASSGSWVASATTGSAGFGVQVHSVRGGAARARLQFDGASDGGVRVDGHLVTAFDNRGRAAVIDLETMRLDSYRID